MIEADRINSTFYAMRLLSHQLPLGQIEICEGDEYPATEFTVDEQLSALEILQNLGVDRTTNQLSTAEIDHNLNILSIRIEELANSELADAGYEIGLVAIEAETQELLPLVQNDLRRLAHYHIRPTDRAFLDADDLVHETYIQLTRHRQKATWQSRSEFLSFAAKIMRNILIDALRRHRKEPSDCLDELPDSASDRARLSIELMRPLNLDGGESQFLLNFYEKEFGVSPNQDVINDTHQEHDSPPKDNRNR